MGIFKKALAECIGTMVLVVVGCGVAMSGSVGTVGIALAFGLALIAMAYSIGNISGCHINPAVSLGMVVAHRMSFKEFGVYVASQVVGAIIGALIQLDAPYVGIGTSLRPVALNAAIERLRDANPEPASLWAPCKRLAADEAG